MTKLLYPTFPRQLAMPFRMTVDRDQFYKTINLVNGKKRIFSSIYNYTGNYEYDRLAMVVDKVFFDFDGPESIPSALALIEECISQGYHFVPFFSGAGLHIYIFTNKSQLKNPKLAISKFQNKFTGMDRSSIGDIARVATIPNTFNTKRGRFCVPVSLEDLYQGYDHMKEMALVQRYEVFQYGTTKVDLSKFDGDPEEQAITYDEPKIDVRNVVDLPPCINEILSYAKKGFRGRFLLIVYLKDAGYLQNQIEDILNEFCSKEEAKHCIHEEKQLNYLYWSNMMFPSCEQVKAEGKCPSDCYCDFTRLYGNKHLVKIYK